MQIKLHEIFISIILMMLRMGRRTRPGSGETKTRFDVIHHGDEDGGDSVSDVG
jgi:hypothetical protein